MSDEIELPSLIVKTGKSQFRLRCHAAAWASQYGGVRLRNSMAAVRVSISWFGTRKSLTVEQKAEAAAPFNVEAKFLSAGKKLLDQTHPAFKAVTAVRGKVQSYWKSMSLPYPEPGIRLISQNKIEEFAAKMQEYQAELAEAVEALDRRYAELMLAAQRKLGDLYNPNDYPASLRGLFEISFDFPSVPPLAENDGVLEFPTPLVIHGTTRKVAPDSLAETLRLPSDDHDSLPS